MTKSFLKVVALSLLMLPASVQIEAQKSPFSSYLFAFFSNNSPRGEQIRYAVSDDGFDYTSLNMGRPVVSSDSIAPTNIKTKQIIKIFLRNLKQK